MDKNFITLSTPNLVENIENQVLYSKNTLIKEKYNNSVYVNKFEKKFAKYIKTRDAIGFKSSASVIHIALLVCGVKKDNEVIVSALSSIENVDAIRYIGAKPIFMDVDDSLCLDASKILSFCENECVFINEKLYNKISKKQIKAILVSHTFGSVADMEKIMLIAKKYKLKVIEDAKDALGTFYIEGKHKNKFVGTIGDCGVYTFSKDKIININDGGMVVSDNQKIIDKIRNLSYFYQFDKQRYFKDDIKYYYGMTEFQAKAGISQLEQIEDFIDIKTKNFILYKILFQDINKTKILSFNKSIRSNFNFYSLFISDDFVLNKNELINYFSKKNIKTYTNWSLTYKQKPYLNDFSYKIEKAEFYFNKIINLPCDLDISEMDINIVAENIKQLESNCFIF